MRWLNAMGQKKAREKSPAQTHLFNIYNIETIGGMVKTSSPPQVKLGFLRRISLKIHAL
jgi:hypothetical protein